MVSRELLFLTALDRGRVRAGFQDTLLMRHRQPTPFALTATSAF